MRWLAVVLFLAPQEKDRLGDALPEHAVARLGTLRLRHIESVRCVAFSADGKRLLSGGNDGVVREWEVETGRELRALTGHQGPVLGVAVADGKTASCGVDRTARSWESKETFKSREWLHAVAFAPDGRVATAGDDAAIHLGETVLEGHKGRVVALAFSREGLLVSAGDDATVRLWKDGKELRRLAGHERSALCVAFSADGTRLASGAKDGIARTWSVDGKPGPALKGHEAEVTGIAFSPDGKTLVTSSLDRTVRAWDAATGRPLKELADARGGFTCVAVSSAGLVAAGAVDRKIRLIELATGAERLALPSGEAAFNHIAFLPDGRAVSAGDDGTMRLWDAAGATEKPWRNHDGAVMAMALSPDGLKVASGAEDSEVHVREIASGKMTKMRGHVGWVEAVAWLADGKTVASAGFDQTIRLWDAATGKERKRWRAHASHVHALAVSPDGRTLASAGEDALVKLWDVASGEERATLRGHRSDPYSMAFAPDGRTLATAGLDRTVRLWDVASGKEAWRATHGERVFSVAVTPDGRAVVSGGADGNVRAWELCTGKELLKLAAGRTVRCVAVSGRRWLSGQSDGLGLLWEPPEPAAVAEAWKEFGGSVQAVATALKSAPEASERITKLIDDLVRHDIAARDAAANELKGLGFAAEAALTRALDRETNAEAKARIETVLGAFDRPVVEEERAKRRRAIWALQRRGERAALEGLAKAAATRRERLEAARAVK